MPPSRAEVKQTICVTRAQDSNARIPALGDDWKAQLQGFYHTGSYKEAERMQASLEKALYRFEDSERISMSSDISKPKIYPTMDIYGPFQVPGH